MVFGFAWQLPGEDFFMYFNPSKPHLTPQALHFNPSKPHFIPLKPHFIPKSLIIRKMWQKNIRKMQGTCKSLLKIINILKN